MSCPSNLRVCVGGVEIVDGCRAADYRTLAAWRQGETAGVWTPPVALLDAARACPSCCDPGVFSWPGDPVSPAPWWDATRPDGRELWAVVPRGWEAQAPLSTVDGGDEFLLGASRCAKGSWLLTVELVGSPAGQRFGVAWLASVLHVGCYGCGDSCDVFDLELEQDCDGPTVIRGVRPVVVRRADVTSGPCSTVVEILFEAVDQRLWDTDVEPVVELTAADWPDVECNPEHPLVGPCVPCPEPTDLCATVSPPVVEWPGDTETSGCPVDGGEGDESPLTRAVRRTDSGTGRAVWDLASEVGLQAPLTVTLLGLLPVGSTLIPTPSGVIWEFGPSTGDGAHGAQVDVTDANGATCRVGLGLLALPCVEQRARTASDVPPPLARINTGDVSWRVSASVGGVGTECIERGQTWANWRVLVDNLAGGTPITATNLRIPMPSGIVSWDWSAVPSGGATIGGGSPLFGTGTGDIGWSPVDIPAGADIVVTITNIVHDGSDSPPGDLQPWMLGGTVRDTVTDNAPAPPICACVEQACYLTDDHLVSHATLVSTDNQIVWWTPPHVRGPVTVTRASLHASAAPSGAGVVITPTDPAVWSDWIAVADDTGCESVIVVHHLVSTSTSSVPCDATILPPQPVPALLCADTYCAPVQARRWCVTIPADQIGAEPSIQIVAGPATVRDLKIEWWAGCGIGCPPECVDSLGRVVVDLEPGTLLRMTSAETTVVQPGGTICPTIPDDVLPDVAGCGGLCICFVLPASSDVPEEVVVGRRRWRL